MSARAAAGPALRVAVGVAILFALVGGGLSWRERAVARRFAAGEAALARDDFAAAIAAYAAALQLAPEHAGLHHQIGVAYALRGEFALAVRHLAEAERLHPTPEGRADLERAREDLRRASAPPGPKLAPRGLD